MEGLLKKNRKGQSVWTVQMDKMYMTNKTNKLIATRWLDCSYSHRNHPPYNPNRRIQKIEDVMKVIYIKPYFITSANTETPREPYDIALCVLRLKCYGSTADYWAVQKLSQVALDSSSYYTELNLRIPNEKRRKHRSAKKPRGPPRGVPEASWDTP